MKLISIPFYPPTNFFAPREQCKAAVDVLQGGRGFARRRREPTIRRVLDFGAGNGAWTAYATLRWPYAWIDAYEPDEELRKILRVNAPPGCRILEAAEKVQDPSYYDCVRMDARFATDLDETTEWQIAILEFEDFGTVAQNVAWLSPKYAVAAASVKGSRGWIALAKKEWFEREDEERKAGDDVVE